MILVLVLSRIMETLTQALQSSGVNMSQSSISVEIDVATPTENGFSSISSGSKVFIFFLFFFSEFDLLMNLKII